MPDLDSTPSGAGIFRDALLEHAPRVLSLMDREPLSATAGCCDRTYWAWKFVDFPGARFQEAVCYLSFLHATPFPGNRYAGKARLLEWIGGGLRFWCGIQHRDGSFDEAYPLERSLAATAFTAFYVGEAVELLGEALDRETRELVCATLARAGDWLRRNDETHGFLSNHLAAAAAALYHAHRVTGEPRFAARSRYFVDRILSRQSAEGWYEEYGGADPGYQTHGSFYLARLAELTGDAELYASLDRSTTFLAHFVHPDGSLGGEYASRNTQTYYPAAFEMLARRSPAAAWIADAMRPSVASGAAAGLRCIDPYNYFPFLNNLVFAFRAIEAPGRALAGPAEPSAEFPMVHFTQAGLIRIRRARYDAYVSTAKGGVVKVFDRARRLLAYSDSGYVGRLRNGRVVSSQYHDAVRPTRVTPDRIEVEGAFVECTRPTMSPARFAAFRLFTLSVGRLSGVGRWLKRYLVRVLIYRRREVDIRFRRTITFAEDGVSVTDELAGPAGAELARLTWAPILTTIHMGSSRYFIANELDEPVVSGGDASRSIDPGQLAGGITLRREARFN